MLAARGVGHRVLMVVADGGLWPTPHDGRFDFQATRAGAGWIDTFARRAQRVRDGVDFASDRVIGHSDWRVEHPAPRTRSQNSLSAVAIAAGSMSSNTSWTIRGTSSQRAKL